MSRMPTNRLEAFSDGVLAIIITIMVLELKLPHAVELAALKPVLPVLLSYVLSFIYVGIYWNNHHHLFQVTEEVSGGILWANLHLLFWLSLRNQIFYRGRIGSEFGNIGIFASETVWLRVNWDGSLVQF
jgi:Predicted integral membrane protein